MIATFAIGNSDDKLGQAAWSAFVARVYAAADRAAGDGGQIQFAGYSAPGAPWQNALWAIEVTDTAMRDTMRSRLAELAGKYRQDSIAWWEAPRAEMIPPAQVGT